MFPQCESLIGRRWVYGLWMGSFAHEGLLQEASFSVPRNWVARPRNGKASELQKIERHD